MVVVDQAQKLSVDALIKLMETTQNNHSKLVLLNHDIALQKSFVPFQHQGISQI